MAKAKEFSPGRPPEDPKQKVEGLKKAIEATRMMIAEYNSSGANVSDIELHLVSLKQRLKAAKKKK